MPVATSRRLRDELNVDSTLEFIYKFNYQAQFDAAGSENELCHVYLGKIDDAVRPNEHEIAAVRYVAPELLTSELVDASAKFTPWFQMEWQTLLESHRDSLARYCSV